MDTLWIQINLRSFINQMDASSWFMTPFWFKCRFFCNVVGLWRRYKYTEDISSWHDMMYHDMTWHDCRALAWPYNSQISIMLKPLPKIEKLGSLQKYTYLYLIRLATYIELLPIFGKKNHLLPDLFCPIFNNLLVSRVLRDYYTN